MQDWDNEIEKLSQEINSLASSYGNSRISSSQNLLKTKIGINQIQMKIDRAFETMKRAANKDHMLLPREKTLLHWVKTFVSKAQKLIEAKTELINRTMWIKLIQSKVSGFDLESSHHIHPDQLVELAVRQANLKKTEKYLSNEISNFRSRRKSFSRSYAELKVAAANKHAAGCLQARLGKDFHDAALSPTMQGLENLLLNIVTPLVTKNIRAVRAETVKKHAEHTEKAMGLCRTMIIGAMTKGDKKKKDKKGKNLDQFEESLKTLQDLETQAKSDMEDLRKVVDPFRDSNPGADLTA